MAQLLPDSSLDLFDATSRSQIISVRGPLLTFRHDSSYLWVARAGTDPRAWRLNLDKARKGIKVWQHRRPDADAFLHPPQAFGLLRQASMETLRQRVRSHLEPGFHPSKQDYAARRLDLRRCIGLGKMSDWLRHFPSDALAFLDRHQFQSRRWHLLNLWLRVPGGRELFDDVPALAWLAASSWCYKQSPVQKPFRSLRTLTRQPRRHLLAWLDLPQSDGVIKLLRQVDPSDLNPMQAEAICRVLRDEQRRKWWQNLPHASDPRAVHWMAYGMPLSFRLIRSINEQGTVGGPEHGMPVDRVLQDTRRLIRTLGMDAGRDELARIESPERLLEAHDRLVRDLTRRQAGQQDGTGFQASAWPKPLPPPVPPAEWLHPISTYPDLLQEGTDMNHCIASYAEEIVARRFYVYAVHHPLGRATLGLQRVAPQTWVLDDLRGQHNAVVLAAVHTAVTDWLNQSESSYVISTDDPDEDQLWFDF
jgi:hypothetical protein